MRQILGAGQELKHNFFHAILKMKQENYLELHQLHKESNPCLLYLLFQGKEEEESLNLFTENHIGHYHSSDSTISSVYNRLSPIPVPGKGKTLLPLS